MYPVTMERFWEQVFLPRDIWPQPGKFQLCLESEAGVGVLSKSL